jgi:coniferyl-aldehyde dehydrogenase
MDQSLKSPPLSALDDTLHAMAARSRSAAPAALTVRTSRLQRLRASLAMTEATLIATISRENT